jgi:formylglycine-generating enzyme required for sulfatase activity
VRTSTTGIHPFKAIGGRAAGRLLRWSSNLPPAALGFLHARPANGRQVHALARIIACTLWVMTVGIMPGHAADKRVALVIGNAAYRYMPQLINPKNDAADVGASLRDLGFEIVVGTDLDHTGMENALDRFSRMAEGADIAMVYYSGHGMQFNGTNYLLPIEARLDSAANVNKFRLTPLDDVLDTLKSVRGARVLVLDACRTNPVEQDLKRRLAAATGANRDAMLTRGFIIPSAGNGLIIAYSTQANDVANDGTGRNSPFTTAFLQRVATPDVALREMMYRVQEDVFRASGGKQLPELSVSLIGEFKLKVAAVAPPLPPALAPRPAPPVPAVVSPPIAPPAPPDVTAAPCGGVTTISLASRCAAPLTATQERGLKPKDSFRECDKCPEMVVVPAGSFTMGSPEGEKDREKDEGPQHRVTIGKPLAVGKFHVTVDQFAAFVAATGYAAGSFCWDGSMLGQTQGRSWRNPGFQQDGSHPAVCLSWNDAKAYVNWLKQTTGKDYRLLTEAEFEYVARGSRRPSIFQPDAPAPGIYPRYSFGDDEKDLCRFGNGADQSAKSTVRDFGNRTIAPCNDGYAYTSPAGSFAANTFGLYDMQGNAWQWTEDCYHDSYAGAPSDGTAWTAGDCSYHVLRGGSWITPPGDLRAARRIELSDFLRLGINGFRVGRTLTP